MSISIIPLRSVRRNIGGRVTQALVFGILAMRAVGGGFELEYPRRCRRPAEAALAEQHVAGLRAECGLQPDATASTDRAG